MKDLWGHGLPGFWSAWVIVITLGTIVFCAWILFGNRRTDKSPDAHGEVETTGHSADGIDEYDNPLPRWWFLLFIATLVFALGYLALYPGLGNYRGLLGWTQETQWQAEMQRAHETYAPIFARYQQVPIPELAGDAEAMRVAERLYLNNCAVCHGSDARGGYGFPDLSDGDWLYGGSPEAITRSIAQGRSGVMPAWQQLGEDNLRNIANYVVGLSGGEHDTARAAQGKALFAATCVACHGSDAKGNTALGAPDLTDDTWLYRRPGQATLDAVLETLRQGRNGTMPAQAAYIGENKVHLVAAYIYGLSH
ncbi:MULTISPECIES: cytochrome-c oxidase, cbb3-type subunit III [Modicisalibacter]|uniref:cytochrome-c oxidase, cbb3-type subunit III n=1 Tax=Modicisalibacter TaxID=574347 RepID=UPI00100BFF2B|nr:MULTISPECIES: cytochrome-c oxidase, cbb3-type subunit III [Halomonadaceae]MBZ9559281.1 cytochrome-c oxidase, cbb3-type subunit III [Modicisalibacter sp. R2A 31.J]MBZ9576554.1 cytochrome-c oxidase, cbb3-type subunit III [Modicisalibacter sp. MOD 31.J]